MSSRLAATVFALVFSIASVSQGQAATAPAGVSPDAVGNAISPESQPESVLPLAVMRVGGDQKPMLGYRVKVGDREYDFAHLLKLRPADTDSAPISILKNFDFKHPGLLNNLAELQWIKDKIAAHSEPWATAFEKLEKSRFADRDYLKKMRAPPAIISSGFSGRDDHGSIQEMVDANAAYAQALFWYFTGDHVYADNAAGILETYANTVTFHEGKNWYLEIAWAGSVFPLSAELLRATDPQWKNDRLIGKWFNDVFLPPLHDRIAFGNREFAAANAMAAIGVYNEDPAAFYEAVNHWMNYIPAYHYLAEDGASPYLPDYWTPQNTPSDAFLMKLDEPTYPRDWTHWIARSATDWSVDKRRGKFGDDSTGLKRSIADNNSSITWTGAPVTFVNGYCAETARDLGHVEESFASEINLAEIAWQQGVDVYTPAAGRLTTFMEAESALRLGEPPPASMTAKITPYALVATWEIAYNHYGDRMGIALPNTKKIVDILREVPEAGIRLPKTAPHDPDHPRLWDFPAPIPPLFASGIGESAGWISSWETLTHGNLEN